MCYLCVFSLDHVAIPVIICYVCVFSLDHVAIPVIICYLCVFSLDHVAIPDFSGGAMENWGLVIYRETALLYDPELSSSENKLMVTLIVAHEIAHTVRILHRNY